MPVKNLELTTGEKMLIAEWKRFEAQHGKPPSQRHLAAHLDVFPNSVQHMIKNLKEKGFIGEKKITATRLKLTTKAMRSA